MYETITLAHEDDIATLTLNRPAKLNALSVAMIEETMRALDAVERGGARVLQLKAAGRAFCSGVDLAGDSTSPEMIADPSYDAGRQLETHFNPLLLRLAELPIPIISAVSGAAAGAGCSLALAADLVVAAERAYFLQAFVNIGLVPDVGSTWLLPRLIGCARATAMMMLGERVTAEQAKQWGMIHDVVADGSLDEAARALAVRLAAGPTVSYRLIRQGIRACLNASLIEALSIERHNQREAGRTSDFREGVSAFLEKRAPRFGNKKGT